ncbi:MAG: endonuclease domain-containing protein [Rhodospirillaceae bacterium]
MTDAEKKLWSILRAKQLELTSFRRQHPIGDYILDFYAPALKLAIECDGGQHAELTKDRDDTRTEFLNAAGIFVLRFWNNDILENLEGVVAHIRQTIMRGNDPSLTLPLQGREYGIKLIPLSSALRPALSPSSLHRNLRWFRGTGGTSSLWR